MKVEDAINNYVAARDAAFAANTVTVQTADKAYQAKRQRDHLEIEAIIAGGKLSQANAAHESAATAEHWANDAVIHAKAALSQAVGEWRDLFEVNPAK